MINRNFCMPLIGALALAASGAAAPALAQDLDAPSGTYVADDGHRYITFSYSHLGFSNPSLRWRDWTGELDWNADDPARSSVSVTIDAASIDTGVDVFDGHLKGETFFDVETHPQITFVSTGVEKTGEATGVITGDLTIKGVTKPVALETTFNNAGYLERGNLHKIGFSATTTLKRSDFDLGAYAPAVGDDVDIVIEVEFDKPVAGE